MEVTIKVDTTQPGDLAHLQLLAGAFDGTVVAKPAQEVQKKPVAKPEPQATAPAKEVKAEAAEPQTPPAETSKPKTGGERVTIEMVRAECGKKVGASCKAVFNDMGFDGLAKVPADRLAEALELVKALPNK